jgi:hypothetical protein
LVDRVLVAAEFADFDCPSGQLAVVKGLACIESGVDGSVELGTLSVSPAILFGESVPLLGGSALFY